MCLTGRALRAHQALPHFPFVFRFVLLVGGRGRISLCSLLCFSRASVLLFKTF